MFRVRCLSLLCVLAACTGPDTDRALEPDPLPSWNQGVARRSIIDFVDAVTKPDGESYVAPMDRIAVFDNDGTLIIERPMLVQFAFIYDRVQSMADENPEWSYTQPFKAVIEDDLKMLEEMGFAKRRNLMTAAQANITQDEFHELATGVLREGRHPRFDRPYTTLVYQPMVELIRYLHQNAFKVFIVSGGGIEFIRTLSEQAYDIPRDRVIGSSLKYDFKDQDGRSVIFRKPGFNSINAGRFTPLNIKLHIGRRPILAVGNSDGDIQMLEFTDDHSRDALVLLVHHDDPQREYEYSDESTRVRELAEERGWQTVSISRDYKTLFPEAVR